MCLDSHYMEYLRKKRNNRNKITSRSDTTNLQNVSSTKKLIKNRYGRVAFFPY